MRYVPLARFKSAARMREPMPTTLALQKTALATVQPVADRQVRFAISTAGVDRDRDTISVKGWQLDNYRRNPVVLWGHDDSELPIGKAVDIGVDGDALCATVEFVPADMPVVGDRAEAVLRMCRDGFLSATSVGFQPIEYEISTDKSRGDDYFPGLDFTKQELWEFSIVSIPSNPEALIEARRDGHDAPARASARDVATKLRSVMAAKGLCDVSQLASVVDQLAWLRESATFEAEMEGDNSRLPGLLGGVLQQLGDALVAMTQEEVAELLGQAADAERRTATVTRRKQRLLEARLISIG